MNLRVAGYLLLCIHVAVSCFSVSSAESLKIGAVLMLTGDQAPYGHAMAEGIQLAAEELAQSGEKPDIFIEDSKLDAKTALSAAKRLVAVSQVDVVLDASFIEVMANGAFLQRQKVPTIVLWDSAPEIEKLGDFVFSIGVWAPSSAELAAEYAYTRLGARTAAIINTEAEWPETAKKYFSAEFTRLGGRLVASENVGPSESDFRSLFVRVLGREPDVLYAPITERLNPFYRQLRQLRPNQLIVTSDIVAEEHIRLDPGSFEGIYQTMPPEPDSAHLHKLMEAYKRKFSKTPSLRLFTSLGYDAVRLAVHAASESRAKDSIRAKLARTRGYTGASATISFGEDRSSRLYERMYRIRNGRFENP